MKIRDGDWTLFSYDPKLKKQVWYLTNPDGSMTWRTDYEVQATVDANQAQRNMSQRGWAGDYHHVASIPQNVYWDQIAEASKENDQKYLSKWLNDSDNRAWRTKDGTL